MTLRGRYDRVHAANDETGEPLPLVPPASGAIAAELHGPQVGPLDQAYLGAELEFAAEKTRLAPNETGTDGHALLNIDAGMQHSFGQRRLRLDVRLRNATDVSYRDFLSRYKEFADNPGRNLVMRLSTEF